MNTTNLTQKPELNVEQRKTFDDIINGKGNFFITGSAGTGKTFLLRELVSHFLGLYGEEGVGVTAMTGLAAVNINGRTLHSWSGMGIDGKKALNKFTVAKWNKCMVLIVDEISMMALDYFEAIFGQLLKVRVIMFGDFFQLPPVESKMIFHSKMWDTLGLQAVVLETVVRQDNTEFIRILGNIRRGAIEDDDIVWLKENTCKEDNTECTSLYPVNRKVDSENRRRLAQLEGVTIELKAIDVVTYNKKCGGMSDREKKTTEASLVKNVERSAPETIKVKVGARVMVTKNSLTIPRMVNGSTGEITKVNGCTVTIEFENIGTQNVPMIDYVEEWGNVTLTRKQYPLKLAWSITIHKSQGLTMEHMRLSTKDSFEDGQCYVGISRASKPEMLIIEDIDNLVLSNKVNKGVVKFYRSLLNK
jgi:ATP-dependent DNA helicase PIF1